MGDTNYDEFYIELSKIQIIKPFKSKIERMHEIQLEFDNVADGGQWIQVKGETRDRRNAKDYIIALSQPAEVKCIQLPRQMCAELMDMETLEQIERKTNAVIRPLKNIAEFEIGGTELAVTLAMSMMEELSGAGACGGEMETDSVAEQDGPCLSPDSGPAAQRLSTTLERALSQHSDGYCSVDDYKQAPDSVKRVLVHCLQNEDDIDEELLFAEVGSGHSTDTKCRNTGKPYQGNSVRKQTSVEMDGEVTEEGQSNLSPEVGNLKLSDKLSEASQDCTPKRAKQHEYLRSFGASVGYSQEEVSEALQFVDEKTRPSDFLEILKTVKEKMVKVPVTASDKESKSQGRSSSSSKSAADQVTTPSRFPSVKLPTESPRRMELPEGYRQRLLLDFQQEDDSLSVEDLKKKNAERQKILKQHFEEQQTQQPEKKKTPAPKQTTNQQGQKGKGKGNQSGDSSKKSERTDNVLPHKKQFKLDVRESSELEKDDDQTCVLRVWQPGETFSSSDSSQWVSPKRKHASGANNSWPGKAGAVPPACDQASNQVASGQGAGRHQPWRKPIQPVMPNNATPTKPLLHPGQTTLPGEEELRYIVIDGSNVAVTHGNGKVFSCKGLKLCVDYFKKRGHKKITVFVPQWRTCRPTDTNQITDQEILHQLKEDDCLVFTPSRRIGRKLIASYDDRFVLELAEAEDGIIVSNDQYRDLMREKASWREIVENRLLMYSFVKDHFMPPSDPLGQYGPTLDDFLRKPAKLPSPGVQRPDNPPFYQPHSAHGSDGNKQVAVWHEQPWQQHQAPNAWKTPVQRQFHKAQDVTDGQNQAGNQFKGRRGQQRHQGQQVKEQRLPPRTDKDTEKLFHELKVIFPEDAQEETLRSILTNHESEKDLTKLTNYCMSVLFV